MPPKLHTGGRQECWAQAHFTAEENGRKCLKCERVLKTVSGTRLVEHLASCKEVDDEVRARATPEAAKRKPQPTPKPKQAARQGALLMDSIAETEYVGIGKAWAEMIYATGVPFTLIDHPAFKKAVKVTRPAFDVKRLPSRKQVAGTHLNAAFTDHVDPRKQQMKERGGWITIHMDAWSSHRKDHVLAIYGVDSKGPELLASDVMEEKTHSHAEFLQHLERNVGEELKVSAIVADAESAGQKAGRIWAEKRDGCEGVMACAPHQLCRVVNDAIGFITRNKKPVPNVYNYLTVWVGTVVGAVRNNEATRKSYLEALKSAGLSKRLPPTPAETRWVSYAVSFQELYERRAVFLLLRQEEGMIQQNPLLEQFSDTVHMSLVARVGKLVKEITIAVQLLEGDSSRIGSILPMFHRVRGEMERIQALYEQEGAAEHVANFKGLLEKLEERKKRMYMSHKWICAATFLSPNLHECAAEDASLYASFRAAELTNLRNATNAFVKERLGVEALPEVLEFESRLGHYDNLGLWALAASKKPEQWWGAVARVNPHSKIAALALKLTAVPPHSCQVERGFSTMGWLSGGRRVSMGPERIHQLTAVHRALKAVTEEFWWDQGDNDGDAEPSPKKRRAAELPAVDYSKLIED
jgi:hypothetical protein